jgi:hypothetical protein
MHMKVSHEQFVIDGDRLTHQPTGAVFWMGDKDVVECDKGAAGKAFNRDGPANLDRTVSGVSA